MTGRGMAVAIAAASFAALGLGPWRADLTSWPFKYPDSWDWLANGLYWAGEDVHMSWRPPVVPFAFSLLFRAGLESFIPLLGPLAFAGGVLVAYAAGEALSNPRSGVFAALLFAASRAFGGFGVFIGADVAAAALNLAATLAFARMLRAPEDCGPARGALAGTFWAVASLTQFGGAILGLPVATASILTLGAGALRRRDLWSAVAAFAVFFGTAYVLREAAIGAHGHGRVQHLELLALSRHFLHYAWHTVTFLSWPVLVLAVVGILGGEGAPRGPVAVLLLLVSAAYFVFFAAAYSWKDPRFALYWGMPLIAFAGAGLDRILRRAGRAVGFPIAAAAVAMTSASTTWVPFDPSLILAPGLAVRREGGEFVRDRAPVRPFAWHLAAFHRSGAPAPFPEDPDLRALATSLRGRMMPGDRAGVHPSSSYDIYVARGQLTVQARRCFVWAGSSDRLPWLVAGADVPEPAGYGVYARSGPYAAYERLP